MKKGFVAITSLLAGFAGGAAVVGSATSKVANSSNKEIEKFKNYYNILCQWMAIKQEGRSLKEYFIQNGYNSIAIYGMGGLGCRLYEDLRGEGLDIKYALDKMAVSPYSELKIIAPEDELEPVDVIVVTATFAFDEISEMLSAKTEGKVVSLEDVVYEIQ